MINNNKPQGLNKFDWEQYDSCKESLRNLIERMKKYDYHVTSEEI